MHVVSESRFIKRRFVQFAPLDDLFFYLRQLTLDTRFFERLPDDVVSRTRKRD